MAPNFNKILAAVIINGFQILLFPIVPIGTTLIYLDLRVRTEGYNLDTLKSEAGEDYFGLFHESFAPLTLHVDSGFDEKSIIYRSKLL